MFSKAVLEEKHLINGRKSCSIIYRKEYQFYFFFFKIKCIFYTIFWKELGLIPNLKYFKVSKFHEFSLWDEEKNKPQEFTFQVQKPNHEVENLVLLVGKWSSLWPHGLAPWDKYTLVEFQQILYTFFPADCVVCHMGGTCCSDEVGQAMEALRLASFAALVVIRGSCTAEVDSGSAFHKGFWLKNFVLVWYKGSVASFPSWR